MMHHDGERRDAALLCALRHPRNQSKSAQPTSDTNTLLRPTPHCPSRPHLPCPQTRVRRRQPLAAQPPCCPSRCWRPPAAWHRPSWHRPFLPLDVLCLASSTRGGACPPSAPVRPIPRPMPSPAGPPAQQSGAGARAPLRKPPCAARCQPAQLTGSPTQQRPSPPPAAGPPLASPRAPTTPARPRSWATSDTTPPPTGAPRCTAPQLQCTSSPPGYPGPDRAPRRLCCLQTLAPTPTPDSATPPALQGLCKLGAARACPRRACCCRSSQAQAQGCSSPGHRRANVCARPRDPL